MADSDALRAKRARWHRQGDHSLCLRGRCDDAPAPAGLVPVVGIAPPAKATTRAAKSPKTGARSAKTSPKSAATAANRPRTARKSTPTAAVPEEDQPAAAEPAERHPGGIEQAVVAFVATLPYQEPDPRALLALICVRIAQRVDETGAMPAAVRELRTMLQQLVEVPNQPAGPVDVARLRRAERKLDTFLAGL